MTGDIILMSMRLSSIAFRSLKRRRGRTLFLILSLSVGVAMMVAVISVAVAMQRTVESKLREYGANMVVMPKTLSLPIIYGGVNIAAVEAPVADLTEDDATAIASIPRKDAIRGVSPKLVGAVSVDGQEVMLVGTRFRDELRMKPWWQIAGEKPSLSRDVLLGATIAAELHRNPGDKLMMGGKEFRVAGIIDEQFSAEDRAIFADRREAGTLLGQTGKVSFIEVSTWCAACPVETIIEQISAKLPNAKVFAIKQLVEAELSQVRLTTSFAIALTAIILVVGSLVVLLTMMAAVRERTQEIGVLRAIGFRHGHIMKLLLLEGSAIGLVAGSLGAIAGSTVAMLVAGRIAGLETQSPFDPRLAGAAILVAVIMSTLPTFFPARRASQLDPVIALRSM